MFEFRWAPANSADDHVVRLYGDYPDELCRRVKLQYRLSEGALRDADIVWSQWQDVLFIDDEAQETL